MNAPAPAPKQAEALRGLAWWAAERERVGTDCRGILLTVLRSLNVIRPCPVCGCEPCLSPSFCQLRCESDARALATPKRNPPRRPTPETLIEAIKQSVRDRGIAALKEPATRERLLRCDDAARAVIDRWLQQRKRAAA
jgi:hypothetical protein